MHILQPVLALVIGLGVAILADGVLTMLNRDSGPSRPAGTDALLIGLAALSVFGIVAFVAYVLF